MRSRALSGLVVSSSVVLAGFGLVSPAAAGPDWVEIGDAGSLVLTAQIPVRPPGAPQLASISGTLGLRGVDQEDLYFIRVDNTAIFSITTGAASFNPVLYLFNVTINNEAYGLLANNDQAMGNPIPSLVGAATDGTGVVISAPGDYIIAITGLGRFPVSSTGAIFNLASPTEISGPDGAGGFNALSGWMGEGETGSYQMNFTGVDFPVYPAPGTMVLVALSGAIAAHRRR